MRERGGVTELDFRRTTLCVKSVNCTCVRWSANRAEVLVLSCLAKHVENSTSTAVVSWHRAPSAPRSQACRDTSLVLVEAIRFGLQSGRDAAAYNGDTSIKKDEPCRERPIFECNPVGGPDYAFF